MNLLSDLTEDNKPLNNRPKLTNDDISECVKYYYPDKKEFVEKNLPCKPRRWKGGFDKFNNISYTPYQMDEYIEKFFGNSNFKGDSPFAYNKDYHTLDYDDICNINDFQLKPQQKFAGKFISPQTDFPGALVYNGLGSGKSCLSLVIAENMKHKKLKKGGLEKIKGRSPHRVIIVVPKAVRNQYYDEIIGNIRNGKITSCTASCVITDDDNNNLRQLYVGRFKDGEYKLKELKKLAQLESQLKTEENKKSRKQIRDSIEFLNTTIKNKIDSVFYIITHDKFLNSVMKKDGNSYIPTDFLLNDPIFHSEKSLIIIDEIQKLVMEEGSKFLRLYHTLVVYSRKLDNGDPGIRVVLLTATPVYDNPYEAAMMINLLRPRIPFPISREDFQGMFIETKFNKKTNIYEKNIKNPLLLKYILSGYVMYFKGGNPVGYPRRNNIIKTHKMGKKQQTIYTKSLISEIKKETNRMDFESMQQGMYPISIQKCNIAYDIDDEDEIKNTLPDAKRFKAMLEHRSQKEILDICERYSPKFVYVLKKAINCDGPVFIYTKWVLHGIVGLSIILDALGFNFFNGTDAGTNTYGIWSPGGLQYKGIKGDESVYTNKLRKIFNSPENSDGSVCKILLGNVVEGVSLKNVRQVHVCEPWWNTSKLEQIIARAIRLCSHKDLVESDRYVDVYYHVSILDSYPEYNGNLISQLREMGSELTYFKDFGRSTIEQKMYISAERKNDINIKFEMKLKESAVDCKLNKYGNIVRLESVEYPKFREKILEEGQKLMYNRSNNKYYLLDGTNLIHVKLMNNIEVERPNKIKDTVKVYSWPPIGIESTLETIKLKDWQIKDGDILFQEEIQCNDSKLDFHKTFNLAMKKGEDPMAWKKCLLSYERMQLFGKLMVKYGILKGRSTNKIKKCLYNVLKEYNQWDIIYTKKEIQDKKNMLEGLLVSTRALKNKEKMVAKLRRFVGPEMVEKLPTLSYAEIDAMLEKYELIGDLKKKHNLQTLQNMSLHELRKLQH